MARDTCCDVLPSPGRFILKSPPPPPPKRVDTVEQELGAALQQQERHKIAQSIEALNGFISSQTLELFLSPEEGAPHRA